MSLMSINECVSAWLAAKRMRKQRQLRATLSGSNREPRSSNVVMHPRSTTHPIPEGEVAVFVLASPFYQLRFNYYTQSPFYQLRTITTPSLPCAPAARAGGGRPAAARG